MNIYITSNFKAYLNELQTKFRQLAPKNSE